MFTLAMDRFVLHLKEPRGGPLSPQISRNPIVQAESGMSAMGGKRALGRLESNSMRHFLSFIATTVAVAAPAQAQGDLEKGLAGAFKGCEEWVLNPASWVDGPQPFIAAVGLGNTMGLVNKVEEVNLPPKHLRKGNHYWRINSTLGAGYVLVVSDQLPICHITGGGDTDLQPVVETVLSSPDFKGRWERLKGSIKGDMVSTVFRNRQDPAMTIAISRANQPSQSLDRVQVVATANYK